MNELDESNLTMRTEMRPTKMEKGKTDQSSLELLLGLLPLVLGFQILVSVIYVPSALSGNADFRNCYSSGLLLRSGRGHQLYDYETQHNLQNAAISPLPVGMPYVHPPYEALLFVPFSFLAYRNAYLGWLSLNLICLIACYWILRKRLLRLRAMWRWFPFLFVAGFAPVSVAMMQGQDSLITLLLFSAALVNLELGSDLLAGFLVGLATYKFQLVLPITGLFFLWRRWRFVCGASLSASLAVVLSAFIVGTKELLAYPSYLREAAVKFAVLMPMGRMPNLRGLVSLLHLRPSVAVTTVSVLSVLVLGTAAWSGRKLPSRWQLAIALSAATLAGYHVMTHDLAILLIPMSMILNECRTHGLWSVTAMWALTALSFFARDPFVAFPILAIFLVQMMQANEFSETGYSIGSGKEFDTPVLLLKSQT